MEKEAAKTEEFLNSETPLTEQPSVDSTKPEKKITEALYEQSPEEAQEEAEEIASQETQEEEAKKEGIFNIVSREREALNSSSGSSCIMRPRGLSEQLTKPLSSYFGGLADSKSLREAKQLVATGTSYGLGGGALTYKVLKAISLLLYKISETYFTEKQLKGKDKDRAVYLSGSSTENEFVGKVDQPIERDFTGTPLGSPFPSIATTPYYFAKVVMGGEIKGSDDVNQVIDELNRLEKEKRIIVSNGIVAHTRPIKEVSIYSKDGQTLLYIVLSPMFAQLLGKKYVKERNDILTLLKGVTKDMTLTLYELLILNFSYGNNSYHLNPKALYEQIAKLPSYKGNPKRAKADYNYSLEVMKRIRLITDYSETPTEIKFTYNKNHLSEDFNSYPETRFSVIKKELNTDLLKFGKHF